MSESQSKKVLYRGVYGVFDGPRLKYIGSSAMGLATVEKNHRGWQTKKDEKGIAYSGTKFRTTLVSEGQQWNFVWLRRPFECTAREIEELEGKLIRDLKPQLNVDKDPVASSIKYNRYEEAV